MSKAISRDCIIDIPLTDLHGGIIQKSKLFDSVSRQGLAAVFSYFFLHDNMEFNLKYYRHLNEAIAYLYDKHYLPDRMDEHYWIVSRPIDTN